MFKFRFNFLPIMGMCLLGCLLLISCNKKDNINNQTDFFGVNLDNDGNQVERLHNLLVEGKVKHDNKVLREWEDQIGSDYELTEGEMVSLEMCKGNEEEVKSIRDSLNLAFSEKFTPKNHLMLREWIKTESDYYYEYIDFYEYGKYAIGVHYRIFSPTGDENNVTSAEVRVGLRLVENRE